MNESDWEHLTDAERRQNARILALEKSLQAMTLEYQNISTSLADCQKRIGDLETRLTQDEQSAAWYGADEPGATIRRELAAFRVDYGEILNMWRLQLLTEVKQRQPVL